MLKCQETEKVAQCIKQNVNCREGLDNTVTERCDEKQSQIMWKIRNQVKDFSLNPDKGTIEVVRGREESGNVEMH